MKEEDVAFESKVASAHKNTKQVLELLERNEKSIEPVVYLTIAGRSNALSGVVAANSSFPVIACPPFKDMAAYMVDVHSSLRMPSKVPVATIVDPKNAALFAKRVLQNGK